MALPRTSNRSGRGIRSLLRVCVILSLLGGVLWIASLWNNVGIGLDSATTPSRWGTSKATLELSLVRGGVLIIVGGTRTDLIAYDANTSFSLHQIGRIYFLDVGTVAGGHIWLPRVQRPAAWSGPYFFVPFWIMILPAAFTAVWACTVISKRRSRLNACQHCGYALNGLPREGVCPECGNARVPLGPRP